MTAIAATNPHNPSIERLKCGAKITGTTAKWVVLWPAIGVYEFARSCHSWRVNNHVGRSTTTYYLPKCDACQSSTEEKQLELPQGGGEKFIKGLGLTVWFLRHWIFVAPRFLVQECREVHQDHKKTMYHKHMMYEQVPATA